MKSIFLLTVVFVGMLLVSCMEKEESLDVTIQETPLLTGYVKYLVLTQSYARIYDAPTLDGVVVSIGRVGDVFSLIGSKGQDSFTGYGWYNVHTDTLEGWVLSESPLLVFSYAQATWFSRLYREELYP